MYLEIPLAKLLFIFIIAYLTPYGQLGTKSIFQKKAILYWIVDLEISFLGSIVHWN